MTNDVQISMIAAVDQNNAIGYNNNLLCHLPNDLQFFKACTWGLPILMGRKTLNSLNNKPLPGRLNIVLSNSELASSNQHIIHCNNIAQAIATVAQQYKQLMVIGGATIYEQLLPYCSCIYLTQIAHQFLQADAYFPHFNKDNNWQLVKETNLLQDEQHAYNYSFQQWQKKP